MACSLHQVISHYDIPF